MAEITPTPERGSVLEATFTPGWTPQPERGSVLELDLYVFPTSGWTIGIPFGSPSQGWS